MTIDAMTLRSADPLRAADRNPIRLVDFIRGLAGAGSLVRWPSREIGLGIHSASSEGRDDPETRARIAALLDDAVASSLLCLITAMRFVADGDIDLVDVFDPDERELLHLGWSNLRHDRRRRIVERVCDCVAMHVMLDIDERMMRRRIEVAVARALEEAGAGKAA